jgi:hypothetical protein
MPVTLRAKRKPILSSAGERQSHILTGDQSDSLSWCQIPAGAHDISSCLAVIVLFTWGALSDGRTGSHGLRLRVYL